MEIKQKIKLHNRFDIEVRDAKTGEIRQKAQAENIILDNLWPRLLSTSALYYGNNIAYGTGAGTISAARTTLFSHLGNKSAGGYTHERGEGYISCRRAITLLETEHVGSVLTEVGLSSSQTTSNIYTHAMLKDMNGNPVSIEKTSEDIITIYATVYLVFPESGWHDGSVVVAKEPFLSAARDRLLGIGAYWGDGTSNNLNLWLYPGDSQPYSISNNLANLAATPVFDAAAKKMTCSYRVSAAAANNAHGIGSLQLGSYANILLRLLKWGAWHAPYRVMGEQIGVGDGVNTDFKTYFSMIAPDAEVKVDGVVTAATIMDNRPVTADMIPYVEVTPPTLNNTLLPGISFSGSAGNNTGYFRNPFYQELPLTHLAGVFDLYSSDDNENWTLAIQARSDTKMAMPAGHQSKQYWKVVPYSTARFGILESSVAGAYKNIRFATPPAVGAVITADYTPKAIPKDVNHVFDIAIELQLGEYIP